MRSTTRAATVAGIALAAVSSAAPALASPAPAGGVFVQANGPDGNTIVAYDRGLHRVASYPTGGRGGLETGAVADPLASQGSLTLDRQHHLLYAVNAGSDTVTVFGVRGDRLSRLQVLGSGGAFPVSVAVHGDLVYVLNARDGGSIQGFRRVGDRLVRVPAWHRALGLDPAAAPEFTHSPGQVAFAPDGRQLLVTTKANTNEIDVFAVDHLGGPSARPVRNPLPDAVPFAVDFDRWGHVLVAEAGPNAIATFDLRRDGRLTARSTAATGGAATCWIVGANGTFYLSNAGSGTISAFRTRADGSLRSLGSVTVGAGVIDAATSADGRTLYAETGADPDAVHAYAIDRDGSLHATGTVTVPGGATEGIAAS